MHTAIVVICNDRQFDDDFVTDLRRALEGQGLSVWVDEELQAAPRTWLAANVAANGVGVQKSLIQDMNAIRQIINHI